MQYTTAQLQDMATAAANQYGVPPTFFNQLIQDESGFNPNAQNPSSSAGGIAQFIDSTANSFGINKFDPAQALPAAASYLSSLYNKTGSWLGAALSYGTTAGAGSGNVSNLTTALQADASGFATNLFSGSGALDPMTLFGQVTGGAAAAGASTGQATAAATNSFFTAVANFFSINTAQRATAVIIGIVLALIAVTILVSENKTVQQTVKAVGKTAALAAT